MCALIRLIINLNRFLELSLYDEDTPATPGAEGLQLFVFLFCAELELLTPICAELEFHAPRFCAELELPAPKFYAELELPAPRSYSPPGRTHPVNLYATLSLLNFAFTGLSNIYLTT